MAVARKTLAAQTATSISGSTAVTLPTGAAAGDYCICWMEGANGAFTLPSGWTQIARVNAGAAGTDVAGTCLFVMGRMLDGTEGTTVTVTGCNQHTLAQSVTYSGVDSTTPFTVSADSSDGTGTSTALSTGTIAHASSDGSDAFVAFYGTDRDSSTAPSLSSSAFANIAGTTTTMATRGSASNGGGGYAVVEIIPSADATGAVSHSANLAAATIWAGKLVRLNAASGSSPITANASATPSNFTSSATAAVKVKADASATPNTFTSTATATVKVKADAAPILSAFTSAGADAIKVKGAGLGILSAFTTTSAAAVRVKASASPAPSPFTSSATAAVRVKAGASPALSPFTVSSTASSPGTPVHADASVQLSPFTSSAAAQVRVKANASATPGAFVSAGQLHALVHGFGSGVLNPFAATGSAQVKVKASVSAVLSPFSASATGTTTGALHSPVPFERTAIVVWFSRDMTVDAHDRTAVVEAHDRTAVADPHERTAYVPAEDR